MDRMDSKLKRQKRIKDKMEKGRRNKDLKGGNDVSDDSADSRFFSRNTCSR